MQRYLVEVYHSGLCAGELPDSADRARSAAREVADEGRPVRYLRAIFVPEDETCFFLYEASSPDAVREAARRSALPFEHIAEVAASELPHRKEETR